MMESGKQIKLKDMACSKPTKEADMKECGKIINNQAMEKKTGQMALHT